MIQVKVTLDKAWAADYLKDRGHACEVEGMLVMAAEENGEYVGCGVISIEPDSARIHALCCEDGVGYLVGKALLNLVDNAGIGMVYCDIKKIDGLLTQLGFKPCDKGHELSLDGYFESNCNGQ